jgi:Protein of unknown function (DUF2950)
MVMTRTVTAVMLTCAAVLVAPACTTSAPESRHRTFSTPEEAVRALVDVVQTGRLEELQAIFGPDSQELVDSSDPATGRRNREIFSAAVAEGWQIVDDGSTNKTLIIGNEGWPFPVPLTQDANGWRFDTASGKEEVLARRIGRNELAAMRTSRTYVSAQQRYAEQGHDRKPAGLYAKTFRSDSGMQNGLYWPAVRGQKRSPLGDLVAQAEGEGRALGTDRQQQPSPFHGYYFKILTAQGAAAAGGAKPYIVDGEMSAGYALVAWPAQYDVTGIMTFVVNQDGILWEKDLGPETGTAATAMALYDPDQSWRMVE